MDQDSSQNPSLYGEGSTHRVLGTRESTDVQWKALDGFIKSSTWQMQYDITLRIPILVRIPDGSIFWALFFQIFLAVHDKQS